jgi:hypothetical protein
MSRWPFLSSRDVCCNRHGVMAPVCRPGWDSHYLAALQLRCEGRPDPVMHFRVGSTGCRVAVILFLYTHSFAIFQCCSCFLFRRGTPEPPPRPSGRPASRRRPAPGPGRAGPVQMGTCCGPDRASGRRTGLLPSRLGGAGRAAFGPGPAQGGFGVRRRRLRGFPASGGRAPLTLFLPGGWVEVRGRAYDTGPACGRDGAADDSDWSGPDRRKAGLHSSGAAAMRSKEREGGTADERAKACRTLQAPRARRERTRRKRTTAGRVAMGARRGPHS